MKIIMSIPNILSLSRIAMAPFLLVVSYYGSENLFFIFFSLMLISDVLDGYIARKLHQCTKIGSKLDSIGDYVTYMSVPFATWWLWPEIIHEEALYIGIAFTLFLVPGILGRIKFGQMVAYHTLITKTVAVAMSVGLVIILFTKHNLVFHIAVYLLVLEAVESMIITFVLDKPRANVKSLWHVLRNQ